MPHFNSHFKQAKSNIDFLSKICVQFPKGHWDWKVTVAFYTAMHLANGHINKLSGLNLKTHKETINAINPKSELSKKTHVSEDAFLRYAKFLKLSRRARYLCHENPHKIQKQHPNADNHAFETHERHFSKCLRHLDALMSYFSELHNINFEEYDFICQGITPNELCFWKERVAVYAK